MFNDLSSPAALIATRRSGKPRQMVAPGPDAATLDRILGSASRVPDHGKLAPWRFVVIDDRAAFAALLHRAYAAQKEPGKLERAAIDEIAHQAPVLVVVLSTPHADSHIPLWEQELSAGAACYALLAAAHAAGFVGSWLTTFAAYAPEMPAALGHPGARIAGLVYLGTAGKPLEERPRPALADVVTRWTGLTD